MRPPVSTSAIYEDLKKKIMKGEIRSGEFLFETQLAEAYGVSRTPVRQAIKLLDADGLLANIPRKCRNPCRIRISPHGVNWTNLFMRKYAKAVEMRLLPIYMTV